MKKPLFITHFALGLLWLTTGSASVSQESSLPGESDWPNYRGDAAMRGVAHTTVPESPKPLWTFDTGSPIISSPVVADKRLYIGTEDGRLIALDVMTGQKIWSIQTHIRESDVPVQRNDSQQPSEPINDSIESPATLHDDSVLFGTLDGILYRLDARTGKIIWTYLTDGKIVGAPIVATTNREQNIVLAGSHDMFLHCIDFETGERIWTYETENYVNATPSVHNGLAIFGGCDGLAHVVSIDTGEPLATIEAGDYIASAGALDGNRFYVGNHGNEFICIDLKEKKIVWSYSEQRFPYLSSPSLSDTLVIFGGRDKRLHALNRSNGSEVWSFRARGPIDGSPVIVQENEKVLFGSADGRIHLLSLQDGKEVWSYELGGGIINSPAVAAGAFYFGSEDGNIYAFGEKEKAE